MSISTKSLESAIESGDIVTFDKLIENKNLKKLQQLSLIVSFIRYCEGASRLEEVALKLISRLNQYCDKNFIKYFYFRYFTKDDSGLGYLLYEIVDPYEAHLLTSTIDIEQEEDWEPSIIRELISLLPTLGLKEPFISELLNHYLDRVYGGLSLSEEYVDFFLLNGANVNENIGRDIHLSIMGNFLGLIDEPEYNWLIDKFLNIGGDARLHLEEDVPEDGLSWFFERGINLPLKPNQIGSDGETDVTRELDFPTHDKILDDLKLLKEAGADFNVKNKAGDYPINKLIPWLHLEYENEDRFFDVLDFILQSSADLSVINAKEQDILLQALSLVPVNKPIDDGILQNDETTRLIRFINKLLEYEPSLVTHLSETYFMKVKEQISKHCPELGMYFKNLRLP